MCKRLILIILCIITTFSLCACGKTEEEKELEAFEEELADIEEELGLEGDSLWEEMMEEEIAYEKERIEKEKEEEKIEDKINSYDKYEAVEEWKNVDPCEMAIQIDDQLYVCGSTVKDILEQINSSEVEYTYDVNLDKLIKAKDLENITIYREGIEWFRIFSINITDETGSLGDNVVVSINAEQEAYPCSRFIDGRSYDDILTLSYNDVLDLKDTLFVNENWHYSEYTSFLKDDNGENYDVIVEEFILSSLYVQPKLLWTGYDVERGGMYKFLINSDTGKVAEFMPNSNEGCSYVETAVIQYDKLADVAEKDMDAFILEAENILSEEHDAVEKELLKIYLTDYMGGHSLFFSYKIKKADDSDKFIYVDFIKAGHKPVGGINYQIVYTEERDLSEGAYELHDNLVRGLLDEMTYTDNGESINKDINESVDESIEDEIKDSANATQVANVDYKGEIIIIENNGDGTYLCNVKGEEVILTVADDAEMKLTSSSEDDYIKKVPGKDFKTLEFGYDVTYDGSRLDDFAGEFYGQAIIEDGVIMSFVENYRA